MKNPLTKIEVKTQPLLNQPGFILEVYLDGEIICQRAMLNEKPMISSELISLVNGSLYSISGIETNIEKSNEGDDVALRNNFLEAEERHKTGMSF